MNERDFAEYKQVCNGRNPEDVDWHIEAGFLRRDLADDLENGRLTWEAYEAELEAALQMEAENERLEEFLFSCL